MLFDNILDQIKLRSLLRVIKRGYNMRKLECKGGAIGIWERRNIMTRRGVHGSNFTD